MKFIRRLASILLLIFGVLALLVGLLYVFGTGGGESTVEHNRQIDATFKQAANYVLSYRTQYGHLPSDEVFESWANSYPLVPYTSPNGMLLQVGAYPDEAIKEFGAAPPDSFLLVYWRGEWFEYYASWVNRSSLVFEPSKYYALGSKYADGAIVVLVAAMLLAFARRLWPNPAVKRDALDARPLL